MRAFVAGASGALGSRLVPQLVDAGHDVIGTHNSPARLELLRTLGAKPVMLDLLDARAVRKAVLESELQREGEARARLDGALSEVARDFPPPPRQSAWPTDGSPSRPHGRATDLRVPKRRL